MQETKAHELVLNLLEDPADYPKHLETWGDFFVLLAVDIKWIFC